MTEPFFIQRLTEEMSNLNGTDFELLCGSVLEVILGKEFNHKGCNINGKPVGYAVDYANNECTYAAQCGTDKHYFCLKGCDPKPIHDIKATIKNSPTCKTLFLFSNNRATDGELQDLASWIQANPQPFSIEVYDAERIARKIYANRENPQMQGAWKFLTYCHDLLSHLPNSHSIPPVADNHVLRVETEEAITERLTNSPLLQLYGISGIGKTEMAKQVARAMAQHFHSVKWIDGKDIKADIGSVKVHGINLDLNLRDYLHTTCGLLIVDNLNDGIDSFAMQFHEANKMESKCIITSLHKQSGIDGFEMPAMSDAEADGMFQGCSYQPSDSQKANIMQVVQGYPLALSIICQGVTAGDYTWDDICHDLDSIVLLEDNRESRIMDRILGKAYSLYKDELDLLAILGQQVVCKDFLEHCVKKPGILALRKRSLFKEHTPYSFYIHQMVLQSLASKCETRTNKYWPCRLTDFLSSQNDLKSPSYHLLLTNNRECIEQAIPQLTDKEQKIILYALLHSDCSSEQSDKYFQLASTLEVQGLELYDVLLKIERMERDAATLKLNADKAAYETKVNSCIAELKAIRNDGCQNPDIISAVAHHLGKFHDRLRHTNDAIQSLLDALQYKPSNPYSRLQLMRIYDQQHDYQKVREQITLLMDMPQLPLSVSLGVYEKLQKKEYSDLADAYIYNRLPHFQEVMLLGVQNFCDYTLEVLGAMSFKLAYKEWTLFEELCQNLPETPLARNRKQKLGYAYIGTNLLKYKQEGADAQKSKIDLYRISLDYYKQCEPLNDYERKRLMELHMHQQKYDEAIHEAAAFANKDDQFLCQNLAKCHRAKEAYDDALAYINKALSLVSDQDYESAYLNDKAEILHAMQAPSCIDVLQAAIAIRKQDQTATLWNKKLEAWSGS